MSVVGESDREKPATDAASSQSSAAADAAPNDGERAGRGGLFVLGAKVFFILMGFVQQSLLQRTIGLADYGTLARVLSPANIVNNVVVQGSIQGVSRRVAPVRDHFGGELRAALRVHVPLAFAVAAVFFLFAWPIAAFQDAPYILTPLRVMAVVSLAYGLYAPLIGALNGRTKFGRQAMLDVVFATLRTAGLVGLGWAFVRRGNSGALGATIGFGLAAALIVPIAARWAFQGIGATGGVRAPISKLAARTYLAQLAPLAVAQLLVNALMQVDLILVGRFLAQGAVASGLSGDAARIGADEWVGVYRACQLFAFLPYQLVLSVAQVLFPMVAKAHSEGDREQVRRIVARGMRIAALLAGGFVAVVAALPSTLLHFAYDTVVSTRGGPALRILALGQGAFALLGVASAVLISLGREKASALLNGAALLFVAAACFALVSGAPFGAAQIEGAALATSIGLLAALTMAGLFLARVAGAFAPALTLVRVSAMVALCTFGGSYLPMLDRKVAPLAAAGVFFVYLAGLVLLREVRGEDLKSIVQVVRPSRRLDRKSGT